MDSSPDEITPQVIEEDRFFRRKDREKSALENAARGER